MTAQHESSDQRPELEKLASSSAGSKATEERLLDAVVNQTAAMLDEQSLAHMVDLPRLVEVARRYHECDVLSFDPILIELIEAILQTHMPQVGERAELRAKVAAAVARPLFDNPVSRGRLELLWSQLLENAQ